MKGGTVNRFVAWARLALTMILLGAAGLSHSGVMTKETMAQAFPAPLVVGEKERDLPVWPIYGQDLTSTTVVAYAFESIDFAAIPGFPARRSTCW